MSRAVSLFLLIALAALPCPTSACSLCGPERRNQDTFRQDMERAQAVVYGKAANPRFLQGGLPGAGATDLIVERIVKYDAAIAGRNVIQLDRYIPILDAKDPPRFLVFCAIAKDKIDAYQGRPVAGKAVLDYLEGAKAYAQKSRVEALGYYARFLDHADETVASDAFLEFARSTDNEVGQAAQKLSPDKLRALVTNPKITDDKLSLFAFLLGACGKEREAKLLRGMLDHPDDRARDAIDGLLAGCITLDPRAGWDRTFKLLNDEKAPFKQRYAAIRTVRFFYGWKAAETKPQMLRCYSTLINDGQFADMPIDDLRLWKAWDLTDKVLELYAKPSHNAPITRENIIRYALCCPLPQARAFVSRLDPAVVQPVREFLNLGTN